MNSTILYGSNLPELTNILMGMVTMSDNTLSQFNSNINDLKTPIFIIKTFMRIYIYDINIISCEIDNYETIVLQKKINYKKGKTTTNLVKNN